MGGNLFANRFFFFNEIGVSQKYTKEVEMTLDITLAEPSKKNEGDDEQSEKIERTVLASTSTTIVVAVVVAPLAAVVGA